MPLVADYESLLGRLIDYNQGGLDFLWKQAVEAISNVDRTLMQRLFTIFEQEYSGRSEGLMACARLSDALGQTENAVTLATQSFQMDPAYEVAFDWLLEHYRRIKDFKGALKICKSVLENVHQLPAERRYDLDVQLGQLAMAAGDSVAADEAYDRATSYLSKRKKRGEDDPEIFMINMFNGAEAARRSKGCSQDKLWSPVIDLFQMTGEASAAPLVIQANIWQAIHIAYAMTGDLARARDALAKARQAAERLGPTEDIFSVKTYTDTPREEFLVINDEMLAALDRGQLWDGMIIPLASETIQDSEGKLPEAPQAIKDDSKISRKVSRKFRLDEPNP